jgi:hypothetical protein
MALADPRHEVAARSSSGGSTTGAGFAFRAGEVTPRTTGYKLPQSSTANSEALPPAAAVLIVTVCSVANRAR